MIDQRIVVYLIASFGCVSRNCSCPLIGYSCMITGCVYSIGVEKRTLEMERTMMICGIANNKEKTRIFENPYNLR